ncbi:MAG: MFS transporter [Thermoleophilaceae bacterium]|nr:MFS transporter [Thermoleophilaceae bacterium]
MLRPLRHRDFRLLWTGQAVSLIGDGIYLVAIAWLVYDISNSPGALGLVGVAWTLPMVLTLLGAGVLSDRYDRRLLMIVADVLRVVAVGGLAALALAGSIELWHVVALVVIYGVGDALFAPAFTAIVPDVVPQEDILQASALKELMEPVGLRFAGPALGGFLIAGLDVGAALVVDAATFAASALAVSFMSPQPGVGRVGASAWAELREGFAFVRARPWLWATLASAAMFLLVSYGPFEVLVPYLIRNDFGGGAATFGAIMSAGGLGGITVALLMSRFGAPRRHVTAMYVAWALSSLTTAGFAIAGAPWQLFVFSFVGFALNTVGMIVWNALMQTRVPSEMLGRVSSLDWFVSAGLIPVSFALTGPIAELIGTEATLIGAGVLGALAGGLLFIPGVRDPESEPLPDTRIPA